MFLNKFEITVSLDTGTIYRAGKKVVVLGFSPS